MTPFKNIHNALKKVHMTSFSVACLAYALSVHARMTMIVQRCTTVSMKNAVISWEKLGIMNSFQATLITIIIPIIPDLAVIINLIDKIYSYILLSLQTIKIDKIYLFSDVMRHFQIENKSILTHD